MAKIKTTIGVYTGMFNALGKILLYRREKTDSITSISYRGNWELPGGAVEEPEEKLSYNHLSKELVRKVREKIGTPISVDPMPPFYPVCFKGPEGYDVAFVTPLRGYGMPPYENAIFVSPEELKALAEEFISETDAKKQGKEAEGLLSGFGKRQHCMALAALCHSPNQEYARQAKEMLAEIQKGW